MRAGEEGGLASSSPPSLEFSHQSFPNGGGGWADMSGFINRSRKYYWPGPSAPSLPAAVRVSAPLPSHSSGVLPGHITGHCGTAWSLQHTVSSLTMHLAWAFIFTAAAPLVHTNTPTHTHLQTRGDEAHPRLLYYGRESSSVLVLCLKLKLSESCCAQRKRKVTPSKLKLYWFLNLTNCCQKGKRCINQYDVNPSLDARTEESIRDAPVHSFAFLGQKKMRESSESFSRDSWTNLTMLLHACDVCVLCASVCVQVFVWCQRAKLEGVGVKPLAACSPWSDAYTLAWLNPPFLTRCHACCMWGPVCFDF